MVGMPRLDAELVDRWFAAVGEGESGRPTFGIGLTGDERAELDRGRQWITAALAGQSPPHDSFFTPGPAGPDTADPASTLLRYLHGVAGGVAGARMRLRDSDPVGPSSAGRLPAGADAMCLVAGLLAGSAAVAGADGSPDRTGEPTAAQAAQRAGVGAADRAVEGADLAVVTREAAGGILMGWAARVPVEPILGRRYRDRGLLVLLLMALAEAAREEPTAGPPASCGAGPGEVTGRTFAAEVTFSTYLGQAPGDGGDSAPLTALLTRLRAFGAEAVGWPTSRGAAVHIHTDRPGEIIAEAYAAGMVFDLRVTSLETR